MPCTGLGNVARGFETFTRECTAALRNAPGIDVRVFGGGPRLRSGEHRVPCLRRSGKAAALLGRAVNRDSYFVEQATFFAGWLPAIVAGAPDLVYFADLNLGNALWHWRRVSRMRYRLLYYNGGATTQPFTRCDLVQQVSPEHLDTALARGEARERMVWLPHGLAIASAFSAPTEVERTTTRAALGVPTAGPLVVSVGALDVTVKRMDVVVEAVAAMPERPYLLLLGAETVETPRVRARAEALLPGRCTIATVARPMVIAACRAADAFVLGSLREGFGLALAEALAEGAPCVAHDTVTAAYLGGNHAILADLREPGVLSGALSSALARGREHAVAQHAWVYERFSWDVLTPRYVDLIRLAAAPVNAG